ncbi:GNAT family N-acetyltransferase [Vibrio ponticus]|uniref:GNAT family N-acetyltransferase n=1 Tax=Vibrio ponticus TaxID=265668 RepID=A0ABX3FE53_9VIBR|nr:GNAT family N-acetyltransferase [Vibrio ponticus]OLQ89949.1 GNAT family N-acetyltransferase [Vibrio ponticus]
MIKVVRYSKDIEQQWNNFVNSGKKKHFMFNRNYMDYHEDRFLDHSLVFFNNKNRIIALLPANERDFVLYSHQGLSFGGLIVDDNATCELVINIFDCIVDYLAKNKISSLIYKCIPRIYETKPSDEELYALFLHDAQLIRRDSSVAINMRDRIPYQKRRVRTINKARKLNVIVEEVEQLNRYWSMLTNVLEKNHNATPVHSIDEIEGLKQKFPENIRCFVAKYDGEIVAGTLIYISDEVAHCQYLASNSVGRDIGALDLVLDELINKTFVDMRYFDFGISNEEQGRFLNTGLIAQKEGFGARTIVHDFYELKI